MNHFPDESWADRARGILASEQALSMQRHLDEGCKECARAEAFWRGVSELSRQEARYEPPQGVLRQAQLLFEQSGPKSQPSVPTRIAELVFDSLRSPLPAGVRSLQATTRHMSYRAGGYYLDLRIEEHADTDRASVVGQLMHAPAPVKPAVAGLSVTLSSGQSSVASTTTNQLGEFQLEIDSRKDHTIAVGIGDEFAVVVPLRGRRGST
jgi:hypothetical protein